MFFNYSYSDLVWDCLQTHHFITPWQVFCLCCTSKWLGSFVSRWKRIKFNDVHRSWCFSCFFDRVSCCALFFTVTKEHSRVEQPPSLFYTCLNFINAQMETRPMELPLTFGTVSTSCCRSQIDCYHETTMCQFSQWISSEFPVSSNATLLSPPNLSVRVGKLLPLDRGEDNSHCHFLLPKSQEKVKCNYLLTAWKFPVRS